MVFGNLLTEILREELQVRRGCRHSGATKPLALCIAKKGMKLVRAVPSKGSLRMG
jgi:hypothetical protein